MVRILDLEQYAKEKNVPIMQKDGIEFLLKYIEKNNVRTVLEIGTAIGYSTIRMALLNENIKITSIERDKKRYSIALQNIRDFNVENQIELIFGDAEEIIVDGKYDLIFIDAAKAQNIKFFEKFKTNLEKNGTIITDNLSFHGLVETKEKIKSRNVRGLVRKIKNYIEFLKNNKEFNTEFISIGDGISISKRK